MGGEGNVFLLFRKKEGTEEKTDFVFLPIRLLSFDTFGYGFLLYERRRAITALRYLFTQSQRQFCFVAGFCFITRFVILSVLGYRAPGFLIYLDRFRPRVFTATQAGRLILVFGALPAL